MSLPAFDPYYGASGDLIKRLRQKGLTTGMKPLSETEIAAYRYGEVAAKSKEEMERLRLQKEIESRNRELNIRGYGEMRADRAAQSTAQGQTVAGAAALVGMADKFGILKPIGSALEGGFNKAFGTGTYGYSPGFPKAGDYSGSPYGNQAWPGYEGTGQGWDTGWDVPVGGFDIGQGALFGYETPAPGNWGDACFITTAAVNTLGLKDDGFELNTLRSFRDNILKKMPDGEQKVQEYYRIAPLIVQGIAKTNDKEGIYRDLWTTHIYPSVEAILRHKYLTALQVYEDMVNKLKRRYLNG